MELMGNELKEYLFKVRDLEGTCYKLRCYIEELQKKKQQLRDDTKLLDKVEYIEYRRSGKGRTFANIVICLAVSFLPAILLVECLNAAGRDGLAALFFLWVYIPSVVAGGIFMTEGRNLRRRREINKKNKGIDEENEKLKAEDDKIIAVVDKKVMRIEGEIAEAENLLCETEKVLEDYYRNGLVYDKYHELIPITMFCEYLTSSRCDTLTGHEGAYNIYENERLMNLIITKLDDIMCRLDQINRNQYMLACMLKEINNNVQNLCGIVTQQVESLGNIERYAELSSFYNGISAANATYQSWLQEKSYNSLTNNW